MELYVRISELMNEYRGTPKDIKYYHRHRGYIEIRTKLIDEGFDSKQVDDAIDEHGNKYWLRR